MKAKEERKELNNDLRTGSRVKQSHKKKKARKIVLQSSTVTLRVKVKTRNLFLETPALFSNEEAAR